MPRIPAPTAHTPLPVCHAPDPASASRCEGRSERAATARSTPPQSPMRHAAFRRAGAHDHRAQCGMPPSTKKRPHVDCTHPLVLCTDPREDVDCNLPIALCMYHCVDCTLLGWCIVHACSVQLAGCAGSRCILQLSAKCQKARKNHYPSGRPVNARWRAPGSRVPIRGSRCPREAC